MLSTLEQRSYDSYPARGSPLHSPERSSVRPGHWRGGVVFSFLNMRLLGGTRTCFAPSQPASVAARLSKTTPKYSPPSTPPGTSSSPARLGTLSLVDN